MKESCEKIQHLGARKDETGMKDEKNDVATLERLRRIITQTKIEFEDAEKVLKRFYNDQ